MNGNPKNPYKLLSAGIAEQLLDLSAWGGPRAWDIVVQDQGDLWALVEAVAAKVGGLACFIITVQGQPGEVAPNGERLTIALEIIENVDLNRDDTGKRTDALDVIWAIKQALVLDRTWAEATGFQLVDKGWSLVQKGMEDAPQVTVYEMQFETQMIWSPDE